MTKKTILAVVCAVLPALTGCSGADVLERQQVVGVIHVVGNEPFAKLALILPDGRVVRIKPASSLQTVLMSNQGKRARVVLGSADSTSGDPVYSVEKGELLPAAPENQP